LAQAGIKPNLKFKPCWWDRPLIFTIIHYIFKNISIDTGWTVTVAGTVELTRAAPDVEMRLSFPVNNNSRPPAASQSDSGFAEDANSSQNLDNPKLKKQSSTVLPPANVKQKWTVTVKKPCQGRGKKIVLSVVIRSC